LWRKRKAEDLDWSRERKAAEAVPKASGGGGGGGGGGGAFSDEEEAPTEAESNKARAERIAAMEAQSGARSMTPGDSSNGSKGLPEDKVDDPYWKGEEDVDAPLPPEFATLVAGATHSACEAACRAGLELDPASVPLREKLQELRDAGHATDHDADKASGDPTSSESLKADGNAKFQNKRFKEAVVAYTKALSFDPCNHVLYSNRSACYAELGDEEAGKCLADAERCVALEPSFAKGYSRKGFALYQLGRYVEAEACAEAGLQLDSTVPVAKGLLDLHTKCKLETKESPEFQKQIHQLRLNKRRDAKMQQLLKTLNLGGMGGVQMFNGMNTDLLGGLLSGGAGAGAKNSVFALPLFCSDDNQSFAKTGSDKHTSHDSKDSLQTNVLCRRGHEWRWWRWHGRS
jgi:tetratricopeptide (TPR) repeat protein